MKQTLLALSAMVVLTAASIATAEAKTINKSPSTEVYYDTGCRNVINHYLTRSGEEVTDRHRICY